jgi:hypothetical protein
MAFFDKKGAAVITGASSGIGAAYASALADMGWSTILVARRESLLRTLSETLPRSCYLVADLATPEGLQSVEALLRQEHELRLLINNAGFGTRTTLADSDVAVQEQMLDLHIRATYRLTQTALPTLIANGGAVVNVSSIAAFLPAVRSVNYGASKAYINVFTRALQLELGSRVRLQSLCPGFTRTGFHQAPHFQDFATERLPKFLWMTAPQVVAESMRALEQGRGPIVIPGSLNRWIVRLTGNPVGESLVRTFRRARGL